MRLEMQIVKHYTSSKAYTKMLFSMSVLFLSLLGLPAFAQASYDLGYSNDSFGVASNGGISGAYTNPNYANDQGVSSAYRSQVDSQTIRVSPAYADPNYNPNYSNPRGFSAAFSRSGYAVPVNSNNVVVSAEPGSVSVTYEDQRFGVSGGISAGYTSPGASLSVPIAFARTQAGGVPGARRGLPPTSLDSFVLNAGGMSEQIYGDEGSDGLPPYFGFDQGHRIQAGIMGQRAEGLTTGHASALPEAWGYPE